MWAREERLHPSWATASSDKRIRSTLWLSLLGRDIPVNGRFFHIIYNLQQRTTTTTPLNIILHLRSSIQKQVFYHKITLLRSAFHMICLSEWQMLCGCTRKTSSLQNIYGCHDSWKMQGSMFEQKLSLRWSGEWEGVLLWRQPAPGLELETNLHEVCSFTITEKAPTRVIRD